MADPIIMRYDLPLIEHPVISMATDAEILSVTAARAGGTLDLWAVIDPEADPETRTFRVIPAGRTVPADCGQFIGTVLLNGGWMSVHVFNATNAGDPWPP